jgi:transposase
MAMTIVEAGRPVTGGVDTHLDVHVAAALDSIGGLLGVESFAASAIGYRDLLSWMSSFGPVARVGVEGTGAYGAGLSRYLQRNEVEVVEVDRANRQARRHVGKSDPADALEAARAALSGRARGLAKARDGNVEAIRVLLVTRRSARATRTRALVQIRHLSFTGPDELRERLKGVSSIMLAREAAALRPRAGGDPVTYATKVALQALGRRVLALDEEAGRIDELLAELVATSGST